MNIAIRPDLFGDLVPESSGRKLSATGKTAADRMEKIEASRVIHRLVQDRLATAALISDSWYRRISRNPQLATEAVVSRLEVALRGLVAADAAAARKAKSLTPLLPAAFGVIFDLACSHYAHDPVAAKKMLGGEERPACPVWKRASHARQAALWLANQVLAVSQAELAALIGKSPAAVCLALRAVEDRRDDPALADFLDGATARLAWEAGS